MNNLRLMVFVLGTFLAGSAAAQDASKKAEARRQSSEAMKPQTTAPAPASRPTMAPPMSEADRKAEEAKMRSEMMKPQTGAPAATGKASMPTPQSAADRKAAETQKKSEMMKPQ